MAIPTTTSERLANPRWLRLVHLNAGLTVAEIAAALGCTHTEVHLALEQHHVARRAPGSLNGASIAELRDPEWMVDRLVARRGTVAAVARELGCGETTVRTATRREPVAMALAAAGWDPAANAARAKIGRPQANPLPDDDELLTAIVADSGHTVVSLAAKLGLDGTQERRLYDRLDDLVDAGALAVTGRRPKQYRATGAAPAEIDRREARRARRKTTPPELAARRRALREPALRN